MLGILIGVVLSRQFWEFTAKGSFMPSRLRATGCHTASMSTLAFSLSRLGNLKTQIAWIRLKSRFISVVALLY